MGLDRLNLISGFRCIKCGQLNTVKKESNGNYFIKCIKCGYWAEFTQRIFNYAKQHDGTFPPLESLVG